MNGPVEAETSDMAEKSAGVETRAAEFPFTEWQVAIEAAANQLTGHVHNAMRNAFLNLRGAWRLHGVDDEMSGFRAITAEEEAATALILALKRGGYPGANRLKHRDHAHKSSFWPLFAAISDAFFAARLPAPRVILLRAGEPRVTLHVDITAMSGGTGEPVWAELDEPLNFSLRSGDGDGAPIHFFERELEALASSRGQETILKHIAAEANLRNRLLYAGSDGVPRAHFADALLFERGRRVCVLGLLTIAIMQTRQHQLFAVQCLDALLRALGRVDGDLTNYKAAAEAATSPNLSRFTIRRVEGQTTTIAVERRIDFTFKWLKPLPWLSYRTAEPTITFNMPRRVA